MSLYYKTEATDVLGNWVRVLITRLALSAQLGKNTDDANLTISLSAIAGVIALSVKINWLERLPNWLALALTSFVGFLASVWAGVLLLHGDLTWSMLTAINIFTSIVANLTVPHAERYRKQIEAKAPEKLAYLQEYNNMGARAVAGLGVASVLLFFKGSLAWLFFFDALTFLPYLFFVSTHRPEYEVKIVSEKVIGPIEGIKLLRHYPGLELLLLFGFIANSFGDIFSYVPDIIIKGFKLEIWYCGLWLAASGTCGAIGAKIGYKFHRRGKLNTHNAVILLTLAGFCAVGAGLAGNFYLFTACYSLSTMLSCMTTPWFAAVARSVLDDQIGAIGRLRTLANGPTTRVTIYLFSAFALSRGLSPQGAMFTSSCINIVLLWSVYVYWRRRGKPIL